MVLGPDLMTCPKYKRLIGGNCVVAEMKEVVRRWERAVQPPEEGGAPHMPHRPKAVSQSDPNPVDDYVYALKIRLVMTSIIIRDVWGVEAAELLSAQIVQSRIAQARQFRK